MEINLIFNDESCIKTYYFDYKDIQAEIQVEEGKFEYRPLTKEEAKDAIINDIANKRIIKLQDFSKKEWFIDTSYVKMFSIGD